MLINPQKFVTNNWISSRFPDQYPLDLRTDGKGQIQQAGFDVRIHSMQVIGSDIDHHIPHGYVHTHGMLGINSKKIPPYDLVKPEHDGWFLLKRGNAYAVDCIEQIALPVGFEGKVIHRSTCNRSGVLFTGSVYDPGYVGGIGGTLYVFNDFQIEIGARIGQFQIQTAEEGTAYSGDYQNLTTHQQGSTKIQEQHNGSDRKA